MNYQMFPLSHYLVNLYAYLFGSLCSTCQYMREKTHSGEHCVYVLRLLCSLLMEGGGRKVDGADPGYFNHPILLPFPSPLPIGPPLISLQRGEGEK